MCRNADRLEWQSLTYLPSDSPTLDLAITLGPSLYSSFIPEYRISSVFLRSQSVFAMNPRAQASNAVGTSGSGINVCLFTFFYS